MNNQIAELTPRARIDRFVADIFNEWAKRYAADPSAFGFILDKDGKAIENYGENCAHYFHSIAAELEASSAAAALMLPIPPPEPREHPKGSLVFHIEVTDLETTQRITTDLVCLKTLLKRQVSDPYQVVRAQAHASLDNLLNRVNADLCVMEASDESEQH